MDNPFMGPRRKPKAKINIYAIVPIKPPKFKTVGITIFKLANLTYRIIYDINGRMIFTVIEDR